MITDSNTTQVQTTDEVCTCPAIGALLPDYIVDLLDESMAEKVESHLVDCRHCKAGYVTVLRVRRAARKQRIESVLRKRQAMQGSRRRRTARKKRLGTADGDDGQERLPGVEAPVAVDIEERSACAEEF